MLRSLAHPSFMRGIGRTAPPLHDIGYSYKYRYTTEACLPWRRTQCHLQPLLQGHILYKDMPNTNPCTAECLLGLRYFIYITYKTISWDPSGKVFKYFLRLSSRQVCLIAQSSLKVSTALSETPEALGYHLDDGQGYLALPKPRSLFPLPRIHSTISICHFYHLASTLPHPSTSSTTSPPLYHISFPLSRPCQLLSLLPCQLPLHLHTTHQKSYRFVFFLYFLKTDLGIGGLTTEETLHHGQTSMSLCWRFRNAHACIMKGNIEPSNVVAISNYICKSSTAP